MISFIWAQDESGNIGYQGKLPWHLPADLQHFKKLTTGHPIVMGKKTFDSFPHLLPNRLHLVLTHHPEEFAQYDEKQVIVFTELADLKKWLQSHQDEKIFVIGGKSLFAALLSEADVLEQTIIHKNFVGDVKMPTNDFSEFKLVNRQDHQSDEKNKYAYSFLTYQRLS